DERRMVAPGVFHVPRDGEPKAVGKVPRNLRDPPREIGAGLREPLSFNQFRAPGAVVLIEGRLQATDDFGMIFPERQRADGPLLFAAPVPDENRALRSRV